MHADMAVDSGRVGDLWDYHYLTTRSSGNVALFRHRVRCKRVQAIEMMHGRP